MIPLVRGAWKQMNQPHMSYVTMRLFRHLGQFFMEPGDFYDVPIGKVLHFIRSVGLTKG
jgi:hypothetical protein